MSRIGANIRALREAYGETQLDLAHQLGFDSPATVSMLEAGTRGQKRFDLLEKIARHYQISESALFYQAWGKKGAARPDFLSLPVDEKEKTRALFAGVLPIVQSSIALSTPAFRHALGLHQEAASEICSTLAIPKRARARCMNLYEISMKEARLPEPAANSLWWILTEGLFCCYPKVFLGLQKLERHLITKQEFFRSWYLAGCTPEERDREKEQKRAYRKQYQHQIHDLIRMLYASPSGYMLAEYYQALFWYFGLPGTGYRTGECRLIGSQMLSSLSEMGNPYAVSCMDAMANFHNM